MYTNQCPCQQYVLFNRVNVARLSNNIVYIFCQYLCIFWRDHHCFYQFGQIFPTENNVTPFHQQKFPTLLNQSVGYLLISKDYPKYMKLQSNPRIIITNSVVYVYATSMGFLEVILWNIIPVPGTGNYSRECRSPVKHNFTI